MKFLVVFMVGAVVAGLIAYGIYLSITTPWDEWDEHD